MIRETHKHSSDPDEDCNEEERNSMEIKGIPKREIVFVFVCVDTINFNNFSYIVNELV